MAPNYQNGKIYKIYSYQTDDIYYGSTTQKLCKRMGSHKRNFKYCDMHTSSKQILKYDDAKIELIELFPCNSKEELLKREGHYIRSNKCVNKCIAGRTDKEYNQDNKVKRKKYHDQYRKDNKNKIKEKATKIIMCSCGITYTMSNKQRHLKTKRHVKLIT